MNSNNTKSSFDDLLSSLGFFGSVEFIKIITQIIKSKFMAVLLGPAGIGLYGLYLTSLGLTSTITNFGLDVSGVKFISSIKNEIVKKSDNFNLYKSLIIISAFLGFIVVVIFSPLLSYFTFQNFDHNFAYIFLAISVFLNQLGHGNNTFLRALRQKKKFAKSNLLSSLFSVIISITFYYYLGVEGIIPALIFSSLSYFIVSQSINSENSFSLYSFSIKNSLSKGKEILITGITYSFSSLLIIITTLIIQIFIKSYGSIIEVGLYIAAISIVNNYVNLIFKAMSIDFFPKLSEIKSITKSNELVNEQAILGLLLLSPILLILIIFIKPLLYILYSSDFLSISFLVQLLIIGIIFRTLSWSISYLFLSKGNTKLYFRNELIFNIFYLTSNILLYKTFGLNGLGIAFILSNYFYLILVYLSAKNIYNFKIDKNYIIIVFIHFINVTIITSIDFFKPFENIYHFIINTVLVIFSLALSFYGIKSRSSILTKMKNKIWKK